MIEDLKTLDDQLDYDNYEDCWFAGTQWHADDVIGVAAEQGVTLTREQASQWWKKNQRAFHNRLVEVGNEMLADVNWKDVLLGQTGSKASAQYAVTFRYGFDRDTATYLFCDEEAAKKFLRDNFNQEVRIDIAENGWDTISEISDDGWEAKITNRFVDHDDIMELFISPIYQ